MSELSDFLGWAHVIAATLFGGGLVTAVLAWRAWAGRAVPAFRAKPLLNRPEGKLYRMVEHRLPGGYRLMAQVSYGEMLASSDRGRYFAINARRADLAICDRAFNVIAVIEYQGRGHGGFSTEAALRSHRSDIRKRRALDEAGIALIEIRKTVDQTTVSEALARVFPEPDTAREKPDIRRPDPGDET